MDDGSSVTDETRGDKSPTTTRQPATIYDIARRLGVSPSTVSRALNKPGRINAKTEQRIREAAAAVGYQVNPMARALPTGRTGTIALILSDITNPVYFELVRGAERVATAAGYTMALVESLESPEIESESAERLQRAADGLIVVASRMDDDRIRDLARIKPLVLVNRRVDGVPSIVPDAAPGIRAAIDHLASLGHRSLAFASGPSASWMSRLRWATLRDEATRRRMSITAIGPNAPTLQGGHDVFPNIAASGVSAVLAYNDLMAIGLLQTCQAVGHGVPEQLSIVGFDDIFGADLTTPGITTIRSPLGMAGETAARMLVTSDAEAPDSPEPALQTEFVLRESTAEIPGTYR